MQPMLGGEERVHSHASSLTCRSELPQAPPAAFDEPSKRGHRHVPTYNPRMRIGELDGEPVLLRDGWFIVASFHPELTGDTRAHELFLDLVRREAHVGA